MTGQVAKKSVFNSAPSGARWPLIAPSVLSADFAFIERDCRQVLEAGADVLHLDVMDGHFVPNLTMGPDMCKGLRKAFPNAMLDVHLMVMHPEQYVEPFAKAGANQFTFHIERHQGAAAIELAKHVRATGMTAGIAVNPPTAVDGVLAVAEHFDMVLVMSVNPGFSGQSFIEPVLEKTRRVRAMLRADQRLEMDGGISPVNAAKVRAAGCDLMVGGNAIFGVAPEGRRKVIEAMRSE